MTLDINPKLVVLGIACLIVSATLAGAATGSLDPSPETTYTPAATESLDAQLESFGEPRWVVRVDAANKSSTLDDWANASDARHVIGSLDGTNRTVVAAPRHAVGVSVIQRVLDRGLAHKGYVTAIEPDLAVSRPQPVELESNTTYQQPGRLARVSAETATGGDAAFSRKGMAWSEDATESSFADVRAATNSDAVSSDGDGMLCAVSDTGANTASGRTFGNGTSGSSVRIDNASKNFITGASVNASAGNWSAIEDGNGHGTWTAAMIAANASGTQQDGMAPDCDLLVLKALDDDGSGSSHDIAQSVRYAADQDADVLSLSLGSQIYSEEIASAVEYAISEGTVVIVAAGNSRQTTGVGVASPADTPNGSVVTVGAANVSTNATNTLPAYFSQPGPDAGSKDLSGGLTQGQGVTLVAPGMEITAPTPTTSGTVENTTLSGTSMATPAVAGGVVQLLGADTALQGDPQAVHDRLANHSEPMPDAAASAVGAGYLDVEAAAQETDTGTQTDAMTSEAEARDTGLEALSDWQGGAAFRILSGIDGALAGVV